MQKRVSVVIPCYQSPSTLVSQVAAIHDSLLSNPRVEDFEIILVNDGSSTSKSSHIHLAGSSRPGVRVIELSRNFGQHAATLAGISVCRNEFVITVDDDGQHPSSEFEKLLESISDDLDLVYGVNSTPEHSRSRKFYSVLFKKFIRVLVRNENAESMSAFRLFRKSILDDLRLNQLNGALLDVLLLQNTSLVTSVEVSFIKRSEGKSNYNFRKLIELAGSIVLEYSVRPLRIATSVGILTVLAGLTYSIYIVVGLILGFITVPGFASLISLVAIFSGVQLITVGIIGEYVGKLFIRTQGLPAFRIKGEIAQD